MVLMVVIGLLVLDASGDRYIDVVAAAAAAVAAEVEGGGGGGRCIDLVITELTMEGTVTSPLLFNAVLVSSARFTPLPLRNDDNNPRPPPPSPPSSLLICQNYWLHQSNERGLVSVSVLSRVAQVTSGISQIPHLHPPPSQRVRYNFATLLALLVIIFWSFAVTNCSLREDFNSLNS
ncbi:hypothetical protein PoB_004068600 [Plakobranchus ocellatus]|uniref:Uncharacterized protein n=1 Tax=Plakobranchus ocellatus TaxID=259542 RepID=A0AAV4B104_9GAST|nr:hypothetical protein PoB_004068600 [Plakobranchus ocellatus]